MLKSELPIVRSLPRLNLPKSGRRAGGYGRKFTDPKHTWSPDLVELLLEEEVVDFVLPASNLPTDGANDEG
jgi:hypothetical protein